MVNHKTKKGTISILLTILILSVILLIALGLSDIMLKQIKMSGQASDSIKAYQAADSGIEYALHQVKQGNPIPNDKLCDNCTLGSDCPEIDGSSYCLEITNGDQTNPKAIKSIGKAGKVRRAIEVAVATGGEYVQGGHYGWAVPFSCPNVGGVCYTQIISPMQCTHINPAANNSCDQIKCPSGFTHVTTEGDSWNDKRHICIKN